MAGREILIKAVAQATSTYLLSVFKVPSSLCDELHSLIVKFWWGGSDNEKKIDWVRWEKLCKPKVEGGHGFP